MRKFIVLVLVVQLSIFTIPVEAGRDNLFTAVTSIEPSSPWIITDNETYTSFRFDIITQILNTGSEFSQWFPDTHTEYLRGTVSLGGLEYEIAPEYVLNRVTLKTYNASRRVEYTTRFKITFDDQLLESLPNGEISFWLYTDQLEKNTYYAYLKSDGGAITYEFDNLPSFWYDYTLYDEEGYVIEDTIISETGNEASNDSFQGNTGSDISFYSFSLVILLPIALMRKRRK